MNTHFDSDDLVQAARPRLNGKVSRARVRLLLDCEAQPHHAESPGPYNFFQSRIVTVHVNCAARFLSRRHRSSGLALREQQAPNPVVENMLTTGSQMNGLGANLFVR